MKRAPISTLHMQMGQEVIYLLLVIFLVTSLVLAALLAQSARQADASRSEAARLRAVVDSAAKSAQQSQPPIIMLREADGYSFMPGSAELPAAFADHIRREIVPRLLTISARHKAGIVEVIGHTDGMPVGGVARTRANLDEALARSSEMPMSALVAYDNAGLGLARAVAVGRALRRYGVPDTVDIQTLSAAQLISPSDRAEAAPSSLSDAGRRRIEIRVRRRNAT